MQSYRLQSSILERTPPEVFCVAGDEFEITEDISKLNICKCETLEQTLFEIRRAVVRFLSTRQNHQDQKSDRDSGVNSVVSVSRIFIPHLCNLAAKFGFRDENVRQIIQFILGIRQLVRDQHATVAFSLSPDSCPSVLTSRLKWTVDTVVSVDSFAGREQFVPYEFKEFCGLLTIGRLQQVGSMASFRPPGSKFGLKRDSRKLHIEPLHLPPEESRTGTSGTAAAAVMASKDGFAAVVAPQFSHTESRERIEIKLDKSTTSSSKNVSENSERQSFQPSSLRMDPLRSPSKYEEKSSTEESQPNSVNNAARSIFARARAEGLLVDYTGMAQGQVQRREPPLEPGSACAVNKNTSSSSLDF
jgi:PAXNEB protein